MESSPDWTIYTILPFNFVFMYFGILTATFTDLLATPNLRHTHLLIDSIAVETARDDEIWSLRQTCQCKIYIW